MRSSPQRSRQRIKSSSTSTDRRRARWLPCLRLTTAAMLFLALSGCAELTISETTPVPTAATLGLPPIGYNHRFGNSPLAAKDGFAMERSLFADHSFWEIAIQANPIKAGFIDLAKPATVAAARHAIKSVLLVMATEDRATISGLLAYRSHDAQAKYCEALLDRLRAIGYDAFTSAQVNVFFTEADQHAQLTWSTKDGYKFAWYDTDLVHTGLNPTPTQTPLPVPNFP